MDEGQTWIVTIIGPILLLAVLIWLVARSRSGAADKRSDATAEQGTRDLYEAEEVRRREGSDNL